MSSCKPSGPTPQKLPAKAHSLKLPDTCNIKKELMLACCPRFLCC
jgi:hypothetical protein